MCSDERACVCGGRRTTEKRNRATHMGLDENLHRSQQTEESQLADLFYRAIDHFSLDGFHDECLVVQGEFGFSCSVDDFGT